MSPRWLRRLPVYPVILAITVACQTSVPLASPIPTSTVLGVPPPARSDAASAFDPSTGAVVLFGGTTGHSLLGDTWVFDGRAWASISTPEHPTARDFSAAAEDVARGDLVLFGGQGTSGPLADTWVWKAASWNLMSPATSPPARFGHTMAYDSRRRIVVLYGGQNAPNSVLADTWTWDGVNWSRVEGAGGPSAGKVEAAMAFDGTRVVVLVGVSPDADRATWTFDGASWSRQVTTGGALPLASDARAAYLPDSRQVFLLTYGPPTSLPASQLFSWTGNGWNQVAATAQPTARMGASLTYCPKMRRLILFGGLSVTADTSSVVVGGALADLWAWDGKHWTQLAFRP